MARTKQTRPSGPADHFTTYTVFTLAVDDVAPGIDKPSKGSTAEGEESWTDEDEKSFKRWDKYITPLVEAKGHLYSVCGRLIERPEIVVLISMWGDYVNFVKFRESDDYANYLQGISINGPPTIRQCILMDPPRAIFRFLRGYVGVTVLSLNEPPSLEQRKTLYNMPSRPYSSKRSFTTEYLNWGLRFWLTSADGGNAADNPGLTAFAELPGFEEDPKMFANSEEKDVNVKMALWLDIWVDQEDENDWNTYRGILKDKYMKEWEHCLQELNVGDLQLDHCIFKELPRHPPWKPQKNPPVMTDFCRRRISA